jgi:hypothetical protein
LETVIDREFVLLDFQKNGSGGILDSQYWNMIAPKDDTCSEFYAEQTELQTEQPPTSMSLVVYQYY